MRRSEFVGNGALIREEYMMDLLPVEDGNEFSAAGTKIMCPHCGASRFTSRSAKLNTTMMTFFDLDWLNHSATVLVCQRCKKIQWFMEEPEQVE